MMRRGRNEPDARRRIPKLGNPLIDFVPRQLSALSGLRTLRHFNLQFLGIHQIMCGDPKATRRHLLNIGITGITVG